MVCWVKCHNGKILYRTSSVDSGGLVGCLGRSNWKEEGRLMGLFAKEGCWCQTQ